jgi:hypothetical protein
VFDDMRNAAQAIFLIEISNLDESCNAGKRHGIFLADDNRETVFQDNFRGLSLILSKCVWPRNLSLGRSSGLKQKQD